MVREFVGKNLTQVKVTIHPGGMIMKKILYVLIVALLVLIQLQTSNAASNVSVPKETKEWTFLIFMNGHDEMLSPYTDSNLESIEKVGSTQDINIVVQVASLNRHQTERVYVNKGSHEIVEKLPRVDMGDYKELNKFIEWTVKKYPAKKYFINVWNHGTGWHNIRLNMEGSRPSAFETQDVSFDGITGNFISTEQMGDVMKKFADLIGHKVDLYGNDACLMSMIEVASEFTDSVSFFASSQENEPLSGWPYDKLLARWVQNPTMDGGEVGSILTEEYLKLYPDDEVNPNGTTFSTVDMSKLDILITALANLRNELMGLGSEKTKALLTVASGTHNFTGGPDYKDIYDFVSRLEKNSALGVNKSVLTDVKSAFNDVVIKNVHSEEERGAHGLSMWLPTYDLYYNDHISRYKNLEFNKKTGWADLLDLLFSK